MANPLGQAVTAHWQNLPDATMKGSPALDTQLKEQAKKIEEFAKEYEKATGQKLDALKWTENMTKAPKPASGQPAR